MYVVDDLVGETAVVLQDVVLLAACCVGDFFDDGLSFFQRE